ncbi:MAG: AAA family ATPase, partial [Synechococcaceae cyanobacterium SM2_3_60]|nr:AAA family ATPase [Synechococcaceae cyanobacterium SM2_3_60]
MQSPRVLVPYAFEWLPLSPSQPALIMSDGGESLAQRLPIATVEQFLTIAIAITEAIEDVHEAGLIHKDINPSNILIQGDQIRLIDFGIASLLAQEPTPFSHPTQIEGTLPYLAPEQTGRLDCPLDTRADLYALGVTFYELLTGQLPFTASDPLGWLHVHLAQQPKCPETMPLPLQAIILKLLRKQPTERYQTAAALLADLRQLQQLYPERLAEFHLSETNPGLELRFSGSLCGRDRERAILRQHFAAAVQGQATVILVGGISGVGKTALVRDLYEPITLAGGLVAAGKYDQHRQVQPYAAFGQALEAVARLLLTESDAVLSHWRERLQVSLGTTGQVITTIAPLWQAILGEQPPLAPLGWQESENRIQQTVSQFIGALACATQPLVLFLDDLQWADAASLALLRSLSQAPLQYCLVIGAYRSNEVMPDHPLLTVPITTQIILDNLSEADVGRWLADSLQQPDCRDLAHFVYQKTAGNPFFSRELVQQLWRQGALYYDQGWQWSSVSLAALDLSDNIIDFMTRRLQELSPESLTALSVAACLGITFTADMLARCLDLNVPTLMTQLQPCLVAGLIIPLDSRYKLLAEGVLGREIPFRFVHDRVKQAAYGLLANPAMTHLTVGRVLQFVAPTHLLVIVNHLNIGLPLLSQPETLAELAGLNQQAGHLANQAAAFDLALTYFRQSLALYTRLNRDGFGPAGGHRDVAYHSLLLDAAEAAALIGAYTEVEGWLAQSEELMGAMPLRARACRIAVMVAIAQNKRSEAIERVATFVRPLGVDLAVSSEAVTQALQQTTTRLQGLTVEAIVQLPDRHTAESLAIIDLLASIISACFNAEPQRLPLVISYLLNTSLAYGNTPVMAYVYSTFGLFNTKLDLALTAQMIAIAQALLNHFGSAAASIRTRTLHIIAAFLEPWLKPLAEVYPQFLTIYSLALEDGDYEFAAHAIHTY